MRDGQGCLLPVWHCPCHHQVLLDEDLPQNCCSPDAAASLCSEIASDAPIETSAKKAKKAKWEKRKQVRNTKVRARTGHLRAEKPVNSSCRASLPLDEGVFLCTDLGLLGNSSNEDGNLTSCNSDAGPKIQTGHLVPSLDGIVAKRKQCRCFCSEGVYKDVAGSEMEGIISEDEILRHVDAKDAEMQGDLLVADGNIADVTQMSEIGRHTLALSADGIVADCDDEETIKGKISGDGIGIDAVKVQLIADGNGFGAQIQSYIPVPFANDIVAGGVKPEAVHIRGQILDHHGNAAVLQASLVSESVANGDNDEIRGFVLRDSADQVSIDGDNSKILRHIFALSSGEIVVDGADDAQVGGPLADMTVEKEDSGADDDWTEGHIVTSSADKMVTDGKDDANFHGLVTPSLTDGDDLADGTQMFQDDLLPGLDEMTALRCLAYVPSFDLCSLARVSERHRKLLKSGELLDLRWMYGSIDRWVCIYTSGDYVWTAYNLKTNEWRNLPPARVDPIFALSDRESLSAGTHLLWLGRECFNFACYKYDLVTNSWEPGPPMVNSRCLFASASDGKFAFVAGGFTASEVTPTILRSAERYDSRAGKWEPLPPMEIPRQKCSGVFMDGKFYVIGGKDKDHNPLASSEVYDPITNTWTTIPDMYVPQREPVPSFEPSPPLVAVANNQLYLIDSSTNLLKGYDKGTNTWKVLGPVPVRTDFYNGWGLAFKSLGDELIVIGSFQDSPSSSEGVAVFSLRPQFNPTSPEWNSDAPPPPWKLVNLRLRGTGSFLYNCAVMSC